MRIVCLFVLPIGDESFEVKLFVDELMSRAGNEIHAVYFWNIILFYFDAEK